MSATAEEPISLFDIEGPLLVAISLYPAEMTPRLQLADWLRERGRDLEADGWAWTVDKWRVPVLLDAASGYPFGTDWSDKWNWFSVDVYIGRGCGQAAPFPSAWLPQAMHDELHSETMVYTFLNSGHVSPAAAFQALVSTWVDLTDVQRTECQTWMPPGRA